MNYPAKDFLDDLKYLSPFIGVLMCPSALAVLV